MPPRTITETKFICPKCGGRHFGSSRNDDDTLTYVCQENRHGCKFRVHESEFWKHRARVTTTVVPFESHDEYIKFLQSGSERTDS